MADEPCDSKKKGLVFSGAVTVGNILNAAMIVVGVVVFIVEGRTAIDTIDRGLADLKVEFREYKREVKDEMRDLARRLDGKADR
jgi:Sec-independent protein translocase protein TatA